MEHKITISTEDPQLIQQILNLIKNEHATFRLEQSAEKKGADLGKIMNEIAAKGVIKSIKDPVLWQKEIRKDSKLLRRD